MGALGYVVGSILSPLMGKLSDRYGVRIMASTGIVMLGFAILVYLTLGHNTTIYVSPLASAISGIGTSMFYPANNGAVMASARPGSYGSISSLLRTQQNIGILGSFVTGISIASASIPRSDAFDIFIGTTNLAGGLSKEFIIGMGSALWASLILLAIAEAMSVVRGRNPDLIGQFISF